MYSPATCVFVSKFSTEYWRKDILLTLDNRLWHTATENMCFILNPLNKMSSSLFMLLEINFSSALANSVYTTANINFVITFTIMYLLHRLIYSTEQNFLKKLIPHVAKRIPAIYRIWRFLSSCSCLEPKECSQRHSKGFL